MCNEQCFKQVDFVEMRSLLDNDQVGSKKANNNNDNCSLVQRIVVLSSVLYLMTKINHHSCFSFIFCQHNLT
jgi:hypothetical protein